MIKSLFGKFKTYGFRQSLTFGLIESRRLFRNRMLLNSYSLDGEDLIIDRLCGNKKHGFYVDVGAYDPTRLSNTRRFYKRGWHGINIDANPLLIPKFQSQRPRDLTLNLAAGTEEGKTCDFHIMSIPTISTFSKDFLDMHLALGHTKVRTESIQILKLSTILERHLPPGTEIDFLTVDVEGRDLDVLKSNDWKKFRPRVIVAECLTQYYSTPIPNRVFEYLEYLNAQGYDLAYQNGIDCFFYRRIS